MVPHRLCRDYDATALSLGRTPKLDPRGRVIPIGPPEDPSIPEEDAWFYVVWHGRCVGLFRNWGITNAMVSGFSGCSFKHFKGLWKAQSAWAAGPNLKAAPDWIPPTPRPAITTPALPPLTPPLAEPEDVDDFQMPSNFGAMPPAPTITIEVPQEDYVEICQAHDEDTPLPPAPFSHSPSSPQPSISSISSGSGHSSASWMSSGTISVRSLDAAVELSASMSDLSVGERYTVVDHVVQDYLARITDSSVRPSPSLWLPSLGLQPHGRTPAPHVNQYNAADAPGFNPHTLTCNRATCRKKGEPMYIVVRGARLGVYLDRDTALLAGGRAPGMKIVWFHSLKYTCFQFVVEYMNGEVGVPRIAAARPHLRGGQESHSGAQFQ